jgi:hypothetical protein
VKDQRLRTVDDLLAEMKGKTLDEIIEEVRNEPWEGSHLISVDELRAAGALDVPPAWRKSLRVERDLFATADEASSDEAVHPEAKRAKRRRGPDQPAI